MKTAIRKLLIVSIPLLITAVVAIAQSAGSYTTTVAWNPQPEATAGFRLFLGNAAPGVYFTNYLAPAGSTSFVFYGSPGVTYRSSIQSRATDGRESVNSPEITWTLPALLSNPTGYRTTVVVYVP